MRRGWSRRSIARVIVSTADAAACAEPRPFERIARVPPMHAHSEARTRDHARQSDAGSICPGAQSRSICPPLRAELPSSYAATVPLPMVGRTAEWERLLRCWQRVTQATDAFRPDPRRAGARKVPTGRRAISALLAHTQRRGRASALLLRSRPDRLGPVAEWLRAEPIQLARPNCPGRSWPNWRGCCQRS